MRATRYLLADFSSSKAVTRHQLELRHIAFELPVHLVGTRAVPRRMGGYGRGDGYSARAPVALAMTAQRRESSLTMSVSDFAGR